VPSLSDRAARGMIVLMVAQIWIMLSGYIIAVALARSLGPALFGVYGVVYSVLLSVELIGRLGLPQAVSKLVAEKVGSTHSVEATGVTLALMVYSVIFLLFLLSAPWLGAIFNVPNGGYLFRIAALDIPFYGVYFMFMHVLSGRREFSRQALGASIYSLIKTLGIIGLVMIGPTVAGALVVNVIGSIVALGLVAHFVRLEAFTLTLEEARPIIRLAIPVAIIAVGTQALIHVDLWVLNALGTQIEDSVKGFYIAASSVARIPNALAFVMSSVLVPSVAHALAGPDRQQAVATVERGLRFMALTLVPGCALIAVESREILALLFSRVYEAGAPLLAVLAFAQGLCYTVFMSFSNLLIATGGQRASATLSVLMLAVATATSIVGVHFLGAIGAALGALAANGIAAAIATILVFRALRPRIDAPMLVRLGAATALVCFAAAAVPTQGLLLVAELVVLAGMLVALLLLLRVVEPADLEPYLRPLLKRFAARRSF
jgi:O-antigen/teichoic acid export membrane protein